MPLDAPMELETNFHLIMTYLDFAMTYNNWVLDISLTLFSLICSFVSRSTTFDDERHDSIIMDCIFTLIWSTGVLLCTHLAIVKIGTVFVDNVVLRCGNTTLLDSLEERVIILDRTDTRKLLYSNTSSAYRP